VQLVPAAATPPATSELATIRALMVTWAKCMRNHGLPHFGDPTITADGHRIMHGRPADWELMPPHDRRLPSSHRKETNRQIQASEDERSAG
jgi:hypothetical protein